MFKENLKLITCSIIDNIWKDGVRQPKINETIKEVFNDIYRGQFDEIKEMDEDMLSSIQRSAENTYRNEKGSDTDFDGNITIEANGSDIYSKKLKKTNTINQSQGIPGEQVEFDFEIGDTSDKKKIEMFNGQINRKDKQGMTKSLHVNINRKTYERKTPNGNYRTDLSFKKNNIEHSKVKSFVPDKLKTVESENDNENKLNISKSVESIKNDKKRKKSRSMKTGRNFKLNKLFKRVLNNASHVNTGNRIKSDSRRWLDYSAKNNSTKPRKMKDLVRSMNAFVGKKKQVKYSSITSLDKHKKAKNKQLYPC